VSQYKRKFALLFAGILAVIVLIHFTIVGLEAWSIAHPPDKLRFESKAWIAGKNSDIRYRMGLDLMETKQLSNFSREEVESLLGVPDQIDNDGNLIKYETQFGWSPTTRNFFSIELKNDHVLSSGFELACPDTSFLLHRIAPWVYTDKWVSESIKWDSAVLNQLSSTF
jgi:hypothetical protein